MTNGAHLTFVRDGNGPNKTSWTAYIKAGTYSDLAAVTWTPPNSHQKFHFQAVERTFLLFEQLSSQSRDP